MKKKFLAALLALSLTVSLSVPGFAAEEDPGSAAAQTLHDLGLFQGVGDNADGTPNFALDRVPTRAEGVTMLVRLMGKDAEAKAGAWTTPFTDVADWAAPYVGYAYANGLTKGTSDTTFSGEATTDAAQYLTLALRAMGYKDGEDFQWDSPWTLTDKLGITDGTVGPGSKFSRADIATTSFKAMAAKCKDGKALIEHLIDAGVCTPEQAEKAGIKVPGYEPKPTETPEPTPTPEPSKNTEIIHNGEPTGIDPQHPNGDVPATPIDKMPALIKIGEEYQPEESDEGLAASGSQGEVSEYDTIEYEKYIELPNGIVGTLTSTHGEGGNYHFGYARFVDLNLTLYVGETVTIDLACFGDAVPAEDWFLMDKDDVVSAKNNGDGTITLTALGIGNAWVASAEPANTVAESYNVTVNIYGKRPSSFDKASFKVDTDYDQTIYSKNENNGKVAPSYCSWGMPKGATKFNEDSAIRNVQIAILIQPSAADKVANNDLDNSGRVKPEALYKYFRFENLSGGNAVVQIGNSGMASAVKVLDSSAGNQVDTIKITSIATGQSVYIDFALKYAEF